MNEESERDWVERQTPDPEELYIYLKSAVDNLRNNEDNIPGAKHQVEDSIANAWYSLDNGDENNWSFQLEPYLVFNLKSKRDFSDGRGQARLGGNIVVQDGEYQNFSSSLILAIQHPENEDEDLPAGLNHCCVDNAAEEISSRHTFYHILERIHWDIGTGDEQDKNKPVSHVKIGGELGSPAFDTDCEQWHYCPNHLDKPRIPHPPMDPILVLNMIIEQYDSPESFNQHQWAGIVSEGESILWNPYYEATHGMANYDRITILELMNF